MAKNILEKIIVKKADKIANLKKTISLNSLDELIDPIPLTRIEGAAPG